MRDLFKRKTLINSRKIRGLGAVSVGYKMDSWEIGKYTNIVQHTLIALFLRLRWGSRRLSASLSLQLSRIKCDHSFLLWHDRFFCRITCKSGRITNSF